LGEEDGVAEPNLAKRAARSSAGAGVEVVEGLMEVECEFSRLTLDFLRAFRRARRASLVVVEEDGGGGESGMVVFLRSRRGM
jgi:hypothetical protein